jgi:hypothetical protein
LGLMLVQWLRGERIERHHNVKMFLLSIMQREIFVCN